MKIKQTTILQIIIILLALFLVGRCLYASSLNTIRYGNPQKSINQDFAVGGVQCNTMWTSTAYQYIKDPNYRNNSNTLGGNVQFFIPVSNAGDYLGIGIYSLTLPDLDGQGYNISTLPIMAQYRTYFNNSNFFFQGGIGYSATITQSADYRANSGFTYMAGLGYDIGKFEISLNYFNGTEYYNKYTAPHQLNFGQGQANVDGIMSEIDYRI